MSLADLRPRVRTLVRGGAASGEPDSDGHLRNAALGDSRRRPRLLVHDLVSDGSGQLPLPAEWVTDFSEPRSVEYPVGGRPPELLSAREYVLYASPAGEVLALRDVDVPAGGVVRLTFSAPHVIEEASTTLPRTCWDTIEKLAAGNACLEIAAEYSHSGDRSVGLDMVDHGSKGSEFEKRGKTYLAKATDELPQLEGTSVEAAGGEVSFASDVWYLTHR